MLDGLNSGEDDLDNSKGTDGGDVVIEVGDVSDIAPANAADMAG